MVSWLKTLRKWLAFDYNLLQGNLEVDWSAWLKISDKLSLCQGTCFHMRDFRRQCVSLSRELVQLEWFSQRNCLLIRGTCSTWLIFPDKLSTLEEMIVPREWFSQTFCHHMGKLKIFWLIFGLDQLSVWKNKGMIDCSFYGVSIYGTR